MAARVPHLHVRCPPVPVAAADWAAAADALGAAGCAAAVGVALSLPTKPQPVRIGLAFTTERSHVVRLYAVAGQAAGQASAVEPNREVSPATPARPAGTEYGLVDAVGAGGLVALRRVGPEPEQPVRRRGVVEAEVGGFPVEGVAFVAGDRAAGANRPAAGSLRSQKSIAPLSFGSNYCPLEED